MVIIYYAGMDDELDFPDIGKAIVGPSFKGMMLASTKSSSGSGKTLGEVLQYALDQQKKGLKPPPKTPKPKIMRSIFVVMGETGEYSDYQTWQVCAFDSFEEAESHKNELQQYFFECVQATKDQYSDALEKAMKIVDPNFSYAYNNKVGYWVEPLSLVETNTGWQQSIEQADEAINHAEEQTHAYKMLIIKAIQHCQELIKNAKDVNFWSSQPDLKKMFAKGAGETAMQLVQILKWAEAGDVAAAYDDQSKMNTQFQHEIMVAVMGVEHVLLKWSNGDLASAINELEDWAVNVVDLIDPEIAKQYKPVGVQVLAAQSCIHQWENNINPHDPYCIHCGVNQKWV